MSGDDKYINEAQQRMLKLIMVMFGDVVSGYAPATLAKVVNVSPGTMTRDLRNLARAGIAECDEASGLWRLTARLPQQALKILTAINRAEQQLAETKSRFLLSNANI